MNTGKNVSKKAKSVPIGARLRGKTCPAASFHASDKASFFATVARAETNICPKGQVFGGHRRITPNKHLEIVISWSRSGNNKRR
jgi:hypothetical protein